MKRRFFVLLTALLLFAVTGCGHAASDTGTPESGTRIRLRFATEEITVALVDHSASRDLVARLSGGPIVLTFRDYAGAEKIAYPSPPLNVADAPGCDPEVGDLTIYTPWGNLAAFYRDTSSYSSSLVLLGRIEGDGIERLAAQEGEFEVRIELVE